ncbi:MAG TPA: amidase family protein, partial [Acidimicrobiales bacterium]|nr:amidase family protein [Acidimicrobiales bacterium]
DHCLAETDRQNPALNAVVWRDDERVRAEAARLAETIAGGRGELPPFAGVPLPIKDLTPVAGWPVTYGSWAAPEGNSQDDELVVAAFRRAGFILAGRTNTPELGPIPVTENLRYGITRNPWDTDRPRRIQSGGGAAAVAGLFPIGHANDGGGSIRIPASCTGLVGLKPSRGAGAGRGRRLDGRLRRGGDHPHRPRHRHVLDQICGPDRLAWSNAPAPDRPFAEEVGSDPGHLRVALLSRAPLDLPVDPDPPEAVRRTGELLEGLGHHIDLVDFELVPPELLASFPPSSTPGSAITTASTSTGWSPTTRPPTGPARRSTASPSSGGSAGSNRCPGPWSPGGATNSTSSSPRPWPSSRPGPATSSASVTPTRRTCRPTSCRRSPGRRPAGRRAVAGRAAPPNGGPARAGCPLAGPPAQLISRARWPVGPVGPGWPGDPADDQRPDPPPTEPGRGIVLPAGRLREITRTALTGAPMTTEYEQVRQAPSGRMRLLGPGPSVPPATGPIPRVGPRLRR